MIELLINSPSSSLQYAWSIYYQYTGTGQFIADELEYGLPCDHPLRPRIKRHEATVECAYGWFVGEISAISGLTLRVTRAAGAAPPLTLPRSPCACRRVDAVVGRPAGMKACFQRLGVILPVNDWATILPSRTTNVSVAISYTLSAVSAVHRM